MQTMSPQWRKSSKSGEDVPTCVEVAELGDDFVGIRDSTLVRDGRNVSPVIGVDRGTFGRFVEFARAF